MANTEVNILRIAFGLFGAAIFIYMPINLIFDHLIPEVRERFDQKEVRKHEELSYLSVSISFITLVLGIVSLFGNVIAKVTFWGIGLIPETGATAVGAFFLIIAISFPTYSAAYTTYSLYVDTKR